MRACVAPEARSRTVATATPEDAACEGNAVQSSHESGRTNNKYLQNVALASYSMSSKLLHLMT